MQWDILGHEWAAHMLQQHIARGAVRQAYLFSGPAGVGRRSLALRLAQALNCLQPPAPGEMCGACILCRQIERMQQADLSVVSLLPDKTEILIDQVRALQHSLSLAPLQARYRVALLLDFARASASAQNALLKTLEEAPPRAILLLTVESAEDVLPTIASRCEVLRLRPMPVERLAGELTARFACPVEQATRVAHLSNGRPGYARRLLADDKLLALHERWIGELMDLLMRNRRERLRYSEGLVGRRNQPTAERRQILHEAFPIWGSLWRDVLLAASGANSPQTNLDRAGDIQRLAQRVGLDGARSLNRAAAAAQAQLEANVTPQLVLDGLLLAWPFEREMFLF